MIEPSLIGELADRDIHLWAVGDKLQIDAPAGALTPELRERLAASKADVLSYLRGPAPASFAQQRLWVLDQIEPGAPTYIIPIALRLAGPLNVDALRTALTRLVARHESLRTHFAERDGQVVQIVADPADVSLPLVDLAADPSSLGARLAEVSSRGFDLTAGPLFRATLFRLSADEHVLSLVQHHSISDAWSLSILQSELGALYREAATGVPAGLAPLAVQYRDVARRQHRSLTPAELARRAAYWEAALGTAPRVLDLPTDHARPPVESHRGAVYSFVVSRATSDRAAALARQEGATLFMVLLAAFELLLSRYSGQRELLVGTAVANRHRPEDETLIGLFVNTLVLRGDLTGNPTTRQLIARARDVCIGAFANEDMPFEKLVDILRPERELSRNPIFQVMLVLQNTPHDPFAGAGLDVRSVPVDRGASQLDLSLDVQETPDGLRGTFEYATDLFERESMVRLGRQFERLLEAMTADPDRPIAELSFLPPEERTTLVQWNQTDAPVTQACVHEMISRVAARSPERVAVEVGGQRWSYRDLEERSARVAQRLRARGVGAGQRVGVYVERSLEMMAGLLGILKAGAAYVPLDPAFPRDRLAFMIEDAGLSAIVSTATLRESMPAAGVSVLLLDVDGDGPLDHTISHSFSLNDPAYVLYTSGSTGRPKGVVVPHGALVNLLESMGREPGFGPEDVLLSVTTLSFDIAGLELYLPLVRGGRVSIATREEALDADVLAARLDAAGATVMQATPATWRMLVDAGWRGSPTLRALCGGEALPRDLADALLARVAELWNVYGPTETTIWSTAERVLPDRRISIGRPIANTQAWVVDERLELAPIGVPGELCIGGKGVALGYWNRDALTAEKFVPDPFSAQPGARMYRTGDRVRWRADGTLEFLGRSDDQVKIRGYRIELGEIEAAIADFGGVSSAVVVAQEAPGGDRRLAAFITALPGETIDPGALREHVGRRLPSYMLPGAWSVVSSLPMTPNGKVDRKRLAATPIASSDAAPHAAIAPRTPTEQELARMWGEVLGAPPAGVDGDFFSAGGNSLSAVRLMARARTHFGVDLGLRALFERPSVAALAATIDALMLTRHATQPTPSAGREEIDFGE